MCCLVIVHDLLFGSEPSHFMGPPSASLLNTNEIPTKQTMESSGPILSSVTLNSLHSLIEFYFSFRELRRSGSAAWRQVPSIQFGDLRRRRCRCRRGNTRGKE